MGLSIYSHFPILLRRGFFGNKEDQNQTPMFILPTEANAEGDSLDMHQRKAWMKSMFSGYM